jgi:hydroxymethylpyrimidine/phosphomethylpyrimidine kinase
LTTCVMEVAADGGCGVVVAAVGTATALCGGEASACSPHASEVSSRANSHTGFVIDLPAAAIWRCFYNGLSKTPSGRSARRRACTQRSGVVDSRTMVKVALTIAGSDPSGGAGIQADLKSFHQHGVYGSAVVTLLTVQNTRRVSRIELLPAELVGEQLDAVLEDLPVAAAKTGALGSAEIVLAVASRFANARIPLIVDPVRIAKHDGAALLSHAARRVLLDRLLPLSTLVTANADEAAWLTERDVRDHAEARAAAEHLCARGVPAALIKGGHLDGDEAIDTLCIRGELHELRAPRLDQRHTHGVGCSLAAAITANLALGLPLLAACERAKRWVHAAIASAPGVGQGTGAIDHFAPLPEFTALSGGKR